MHLQDGLNAASDHRKADISDRTDYYRRKKFGGIGRPQQSERQSLHKENERLKKTVADLQLDKLILKKSLDHFKPKA